MAVRRVVQIPDSVLSQPSTSIDAIDDVVRALVDDLLDTMRVSPGCVGLASPQIGVPLRAFVMDVSSHKKTNTCHGLVTLLNPVIVEATGPAVGREGCMSVPDLTGDVPRATKIVVSGIDIDGNELTITTDAFEAKAIQHEMDHLDGLVFLDRVKAGGVFARKVYR